MVIWIKKVLKCAGAFFILLIPGIFTTVFTIKFIEKIYKQRRL